MTARVQLPAALREYAAGAQDLEVQGDDVAGVLAELARRYPLLRRHLFDDAGPLRAFVRVYLNDEDVRDLASGGTTPVRAGDVILIVPSIAGGAQAALLCGSSAGVPCAVPVTHTVAVSRTGGVRYPVTRTVAVCGTRNANGLRCAVPVTRTVCGVRYP